MSQKWAFSKEFSLSFQAAQTDLESRIKAAKESPSKELLAELSTELAKLTKSLGDATGSLPSYDQRTYELQLKELEKSLNELQQPQSKSRFAFRRKAPVARDTPVVTADREDNRSSLSSVVWTLSNRTEQYLSDTAIETQASDLTISNLNSCIVDLTSRPGISSLHIRNLKSTVLLLPAIPGSVLLHDLENCTIAVGAHQFRMHTSAHVDVYISIASSPIIEHCKDIRFAPYPAGLSAEPNTLVAEGYRSVQDFSHIKTSPSPNWSVLPTEQAVKDWEVKGGVLKETLARFRVIDA